MLPAPDSVSFLVYQLPPMPVTSLVCSRIVCHFPSLQSYCPLLKLPQLSTAAYGVTEGQLSQNHQGTPVTSEVPLLQFLLL